MTHGVGLRVDDLRQEYFRRGIAVEHAILRTLLEVQDELQRNARIARPAWMRRIPAIACKVARIVGVHRRAPCPIHISRVARSSSVIPVILPSGMVRMASCCCTWGRWAST